MKLNHTIGGILLVAGTTIGAGMLALPVITGLLGFIPSFFIFISIWLIMLLTAFFFLDVNLSLQGEPNLISMAHKTLGKVGKIVSWVFYLLLLYSLTAAYIAGCGPLLGAWITGLTGWTVPSAASPFLLPLLFGGFVYLGTLGVDLINRLLMVGLVGAYLWIGIFLPEKVELSRLLHSDLNMVWSVFPVILTSFGYHIIIPSLSTYLHHDRKHLVKIILIGSAIPLVIYLLWEFLTIGTIPLAGENSLISAWKSGSPATVPLSLVLDSPWIARGASAVTFFAIVTSFLGVTLSLSDFLTDGFKIKKSKKGRLIACLLTFIPPLIFVFTSERVFITALQYAGVFVAVLLVFLPALMAWHLKKHPFYHSRKGKALLLFVMGFACFIVIVALLQQWRVFDAAFLKYT